MEVEWKAFEDAFVGVAEKQFGRASGKEILFNKDKPNLVDGRNSESNRRKFKYMEDNRSDQGEWGNNRI